MRNRFEDRIASALPKTFAYEAKSLAYQAPPQRYTPDWVSKDGLTIIEAKGLWREASRKTMRLIRQQHPGLRIIMIFQTPTRTISKLSRTTYADHARKMGLEVMTIEEAALLLA